MKNMSWVKDIRTCFVADKKYCYIYPDPKFNENGKTYSGVAQAWLDGDREHYFLVPFCTKYDEIYETIPKIEEGIRKHVLETQL